MKDYIKEFEQYLVESKGVSSNTLEAYLRDISQILTYARTKGIEEPEGIDSPFVSGYVDHLLAQGRSHSTVTRVVASVRCYYKYLNFYGFSSVNPAAAIKLQREEKKLPQILSAEEIDLLLAQPVQSDPKGCRDKAMLELLYATGIRVSELIDLNVTDVNTEVEVVFCRSGKTTRCLPIYSNAARAIEEYISRVRSVVVADTEELALFTNLNGTRLTRQGFWKIIKFYTRQAGVNKDITPHTLRHSLATHMLAKGAQLKDIQAILGHADISSTQVYAQIMRDQYASIYKKFHPRAK